MKIDTRATLYYNKYKYKTTLFYTKDYDSNSWCALTGKRYSNYRTILGLIKDFIRDYNADNKFRRKASSVTLYSNDLDTVIKFRLLNIKEATPITEVELAPHGTKLFSRTPPAKYRAYLKNARIDSKFIDDFGKFLSKNTKIKPNSSLIRLIFSKKFNSRLAGGYYPNRTSHNYWIHSSQFFDYDEPSILTYVNLMFSDIIGKTYKLEKKQN